MSTFYDDMLKGNTIKELVKVLLEKSGYLVVPYGYEDLKDFVEKYGPPNSDKPVPLAIIRASYSLRE